MPECQVPHWAASALHPGDLLGRHHLHLPRQPGWEKQCEQIQIFVKFYELNTFAGGLDAVLALPGAGDLQGGFKQPVRTYHREKSTVMYFTEGSAAIGLRVGTCVAYAIVVMGLLWLDKTELLGILLGIVMCGMVSILPLIYWLVITIILWQHI